MGQGMMGTYFLAFLGGAAGSICRFWLSGVVAQRFGETFPYGTLAVNVIGSWIIGFSAGWLGRHDGVFWVWAARAFIIVGFCGGLTTFSSFSLQTWNLILSNRWFGALMNVVGSTALCLAAVALGWDWALNLP